MAVIYNAYGEPVILGKEQQACVEYKGKKVFDLVIQGVAGAGKSLVLLGRVLDYLMKYPEDSIAFFTYNNTLAKSIKDMFRNNHIPESRVYVSTLDSYLNAVFQKMPGHFNRNAVYEKAAPKFMEQAIQNHEKKTGSHTRLHDVKIQYWLDEITWMKKHDIGEQDFARYLEIKRTGRGRDVRITNQDKIIVFQFYTEYAAVLKSKSLCEWEDKYLFISHNVEKIPASMKFNHIFIDEAQDQSRTKIIGLYGLKSDTAKGCPPDVTIAMDMNQSIYSGLDSPFYGIKREVRKLDKTYRCSIEIDALAESLRKHNDNYLEEEDKNPHVKPTVSTGILPIIHECSNAADEKRYVTELIKKWQARDSKITIGILSTTNAQNDVYAEWMTDAGIKHEKIVKDSEFSVSKPGVKVATIYSTKGMEFTHVIIPQFEEGKLPKIHEKKDEEIIQDEIVRNRSLAYVGMTRAMQGLVITYSERQSRFIGEMDRSLCKFEATSVAPSSTRTTTKPTRSSSGLTRIGATVSTRVTSSSMGKTNSSRTGTNTGGLKQYFQSKGLEVIDKRSNGGCLWVVGDEKKLKPYIDEVKKLFGAYGSFGAGRATKQRRSWFTKCQK